MTGPSWVLPELSSGRSTGRLNEHYLKAINRNNLGLLVFGKILLSSKSTPPPNLLITSALEFFLFSTIYLCVAFGAFRGILIFTHLDYLSRTKTS